MMQRSDDDMMTRRYDDGRYDETSSYSTLPAAVPTFTSPCTRDFPSINQVTMLSLQVQVDECSDYVVTGAR